MTEAEGLDSMFTETYKLEEQSGVFLRRNIGEDLTTLSILDIEGDTLSFHWVESFDGDMPFIKSYNEQKGKKIIVSYKKTSFYDWQLNENVEIFLIKKIKFE